MSSIANGEGQRLSSSQWPWPIR